MTRRRRALVPARRKPGVVPVMHEETPAKLFVVEDIVRRYAENAGSSA
jgi:hypothetical protein